MEYAGWCTALLSLTLTFNELERKQDRLWPMETEYVHVPWDTQRTVEGMGKGVLLFFLLPSLVPFVPIQQTHELDATTID